MDGFLQGFYAEAALYNVDSDAVALEAVAKALEIAKLGLKKEANDIITVCTNYYSGLDENVIQQRQDTVCQLELFWEESGVTRPEGYPLAQEKYRDDKTSWVEDLEKEAHTNITDLEKLLHDEALPAWSLDEKSFEVLSKKLETLKELDDANATSRNANPRRLSGCYAALIWIALHLGRTVDAEELLQAAAARIHCQNQAWYLGMVRPLWRPYFLSGWFRKQLGVSLPRARNYARLVRDPVKDRLENGHRRFNDLYADYSLKQLLDVINVNTVSDPEFNDSHEYPLSVLNPPATPQAIAGAERRLGRRLPPDVKEYLRLANGCEKRIKSNPRPYVFFDRRLVPLAEFSWEDEDYLEDYSCELVPRTRNVEWPGITGGGIAMYQHEGSYTLYVWILGEEMVMRAKKCLEDAYEKMSDEEKGRIDKKIECWYGSRETFDKMEQCIFAQPWGEPSPKPFPNFRSYLCFVAFEQRERKECSPIPGPE